MSPDQEAFGLVLAFFKNDLEKANTWWFAENPLFGNISADQLVRLGRSEKLLKLVRQQIEGNAA